MLDDLHNEDLESINDIFPQSICAEERLWRGVLCQAVIDYKLNWAKASLRAERLKLRQYSRDAKNWIIAGTDFNKVCELANLPPDLTRSKLLEFLTNPESKTISQLRKQAESYEKCKTKLLNEI